MQKSHNRIARASEPEEREWSLKWVALALIGLIAALCWSLAAASYAHNELGWRTGGVEAAGRGEIETGHRGRRAFADFLNNSIEQLPNAPQVIGYTLTHAWWVLILFGVLEALAVLFWVKARSLEKEFDAEARRRK